MTIHELNRQIMLAGYRPSAGCWEDKERIYAYSVESCGPATYGHPKFALDHRKDTGVTYCEGRPYTLK